MWRHWVKQHIRSKKLRTLLLWVDRRLVLKRAVNQFKAEPSLALADENLLNDLVYGWGNENWSAQNEYLQSCIEQLLKNKGDVLECGSGLTSLLAGIIAQKQSFRVVSFEHHAQWAERINRTLNRFGIDSVSLIVTPLRDYGNYAWYQVPADRLKQLNPVSLVICDGPPHSTKGGRYGVVPQMRRYFCDSVLILLDDAARPAEQQVAKSWCQEFGFVATLHGEHKPYMLVKKIAKDITTGRATVA